MAFKIPHNILKLILVSSYNQMNMICHYNPCINIQSFSILTEPETGEDNIPVFVSDKNINPIDHCKTYKVEFGLIMEFVPGTHSVNLPKFLTNKHHCEIAGFMN